MIDEAIIIDKLELIKKNSKIVMGNHIVLKQEHFEKILNLLIDYINEHKE